jgi:hypothetical protein
MSSYPHRFVYLQIERTEAKQQRLAAQKLQRRGGGEDRLRRAQQQQLSSEFLEGMPCKSANGLPLVGSVLEIVFVPFFAADDEDDFIDRGQAVALFVSLYRFGSVV